LSVWRATTNEIVLEGLARFVLSELDARSKLRYETDLKEFQNTYLADPPERRRALVGKVLDLAQPAWAQARALVFTPWPLLTKEDLPWLVQELRGSHDKNRQHQWTQLIVALVSWEDFGSQQFVWDASEDLPILKTALDAISYIPLDGD